MGDLKPGRYCVGKDATGKKLYRTLTATELQEYANNTNLLINAGYNPPLLLEHPALASDEGSPRLRTAWDEKADKIRNSAGFIEKALIGPDGALGYELEVPDADIYKKLENGTIKFTSPELRTKEFTPGSGMTFTNFISHAALTHKPRNPDQSVSVAMACQFSIEDMEEEKADPKDEESKVDDDKEIEIKDGDDTEELPDDEQSGDLISLGDVHKSVYDSAIMVLKAKGMDFPDDMLPDQFFPMLLAQLNKTSGSGDGGMVEETPPVQYSVSDTEVEGFGNKLLARAIKIESAALKKRIDSIKLPALAKKLSELVGAVQFSADADESPMLTLSQTVEMIDNSIPESLHELLSTHGDQFSEAEHPNPEFLLVDGQVTAEQAKALNDKWAKAGVPGLNQQPQTVS